MGSVGISGPPEAATKNTEAPQKKSRAAGRRLCRGNSNLIYLRVDLSSKSSIFQLIYLPNIG
jgi:hypothetical protein